MVSWLAQSPHSERVLGSVPSCDMESACSPGVHMGSLWVCWLPHIAQKHLINTRCVVSVNLFVSCGPAWSRDGLTTCSDGLGSAPTTLNCLGTDN